MSNIKQRMKTGEGMLKSKQVKKYESSDSESEDYSDTEKESQKDYKVGGYHQVNIGETYNNRFLVLEKLGWGYFSTVWLCYDKTNENFVAMKVQKSAKNYREAAMDEIELLKQISLGPGLIKLIDSFTHRGPNGLHVCIVTEVLGNNLLSLIKKYKDGLPLDIVKLIAKNMLEGLAFFHE